MAKAILTYNGKPYSFDELAIAFARIKNTIPPVVGQLAVNHFKDSFRNQGFTRRILIPWKSTKTKNNRFGQKSKGILIQSGKLRNAIHVSKASFKEIVIANGMPYAAAHNFGFKGMVTIPAHTRNKYRKFFENYYDKNGKLRKKKASEVSAQYAVKAHTRNINLPKRQFMGDSIVLENEITSYLTKTIEHALK